MSYIECNAVLANNVFKSNNDIVFEYIIPKDSTQKIRKFIFRTENESKSTQILDRGKKGAKIQLVFDQTKDKIQLISYAWLT
jgi:hypothetical protein